MASSATYARRKQAGQCPNCTSPAQLGYVYCPCCRQTMQPGYVDPCPVNGPAIAHCGAWHAITTVPVRCGTCGAVVLGEHAP